MKKFLYVSAIALVMAIPAAPAFAAGGDKAENRGAAWQQDSMQQSGMSQSNPASQLDQSTVRSIQQALNEQGFNPGQIDGQWGPNTQASLRNFQSEQGLQATGQPTSDTLQALGVDAQQRTMGMGGNVQQASRLDQSTVRSIQQALNDEGFNPGPVDGQWGPSTQASLRNFQQDQGLQATGQPTSETLQALGVDAQNTGSSQ